MHLIEVIPYRYHFMSANLIKCFGKEVKLVKVIKISGTFLL